MLVTGHTGFKGGWLVLWLSRLGAKVTGFALEPETEPSLFGLGAGGHANTVIGDVRDRDAVRDCVSACRPEVIFHMAAQALVRPSYEDPVGTYATNVMGTVHLLDAVRQAVGVRAVVAVTSDKCYENREWLWAYRKTSRWEGMILTATRRAVPNSWSRPSASPTSPAPDAPSRPAAPATSSAAAIGRGTGSFPT